MKFDKESNTFIDDSNRKWHQVHQETEACARRGCVIHSPSDHHMKDWPLVMRPRGGHLLSERICNCGVGHPDPDYLAYILDSFGENESKNESIHGCCGCCIKEEIDY